MGQTYWTKACADAIQAGGMYGLAELGKICTEELMQEVGGVGAGQDMHGGADAGVGWGRSWARYARRS